MRPDHTGLDTQHSVEFCVGQRLFPHRHRTENLGVELNFIERNAIGDAKIESLAHRAHLHRQADSRKPDHKVTTRSYAPA